MVLAEFPGSSRLVRCLALKKGPFNAVVELVKMKIEGNVLYLLEAESGKFAFDDEEDAIDEIREMAEEGDPDFENVLLFEVDIGGEEWNVNQIPWSKIAAKLFGG
ncbi:hypothetical protein AKJ41_03025 [candidate division MSBL1 archaeon SCGC-AAA259O05]|uniref:Uncharacterized protein n=1 Tax=candidate division MSBL1 archaeon SCGC-AAA259O05 TaxID=1698271 RepID=A0A133V3L4_9EURY|nr:hypothetical protein AKJ41_03025 [candidate division MSBL1 archaeon SCGC-AAA259O05]